jgi:FkbM family methyltransferase
MSFYAKKLAKWIANIFLPGSILLELKARRAWRAPKDVETILLPVFAQNGIFVDVGANIGAWSIVAARIFREVHAFEPEDGLATVLERILPSNVTVHCVALSDREGFGRFAIPILNGRELSTRASLERNANHGLKETVRQVKLATLDSFDLRGLDAIKIDVEGHEAYVLEGASKSIGRERPFLVVEIEERHHPGQSEAIIESLLSRDYLCSFVRDGQLEHFRSGTVEHIQARFDCEAIGNKPAEYINNFIFFPKERAGLIDVANRILAKEICCKG